MYHHNHVDSICVVNTKVHHKDLLPVNDNTAGASNDAFLLNTLKTFFRLSRVVLDLHKYFLSGAIKLASVFSLVKANFQPIRTQALPRSR